MADQREGGISWTERTWNPIRGCSLVSEGCRNCYAMHVAARFNGPGLPYEGLAVRGNNGPRWTGQIKLVENHLHDPLHWKRPRRVFVNSMSDLFHESIDTRWIDQIFAVMALSPHHTFQVLTKRPERMRKYFAPIGGTTRRDWVGSQAARIKDTHRMPQFEWPLPNVWLGVSVEDQAAANGRIPLLMETPAAVRWISAEPLLGPIDLGAIRFDAGAGLFGDALQWHHLPHLDTRRYPHLDWVVVGGESGQGARPMNPGWVRTLRHQCVAAGIPFHFKQWGNWKCSPGEPGDSLWLDGEFIPTPTHAQHLSGLERTDAQFMRNVGKHAAGRLLDGRTWDEYPNLTGNVVTPEAPHGGA